MIKTEIIRCPFCHASLNINEFFCSNCKKTFSKEEYLKRVKKFNMVNYIISNSLSSNIFDVTSLKKENLNFSLYPDHSKFKEYVDKLKENISFLAKIENGNIYGSAKNIIIDNALFIDFIESYAQRYMVNLLTNLYKFPKPRIMNKSVLVYLIVDFYNYFHFLFDFIPQLYLSENLTGYDFVLINKKEKIFHHEIFKYLSLEKKYNFIEVDIVRHKLKKHVYIPMPKNFYGKDLSLYVPVVRYNSDYIPKWAVLYVKKLLFDISKNYKDTKTRRLYISRKDVGRRIILNETEIVNLLRKYGFEIITLSGLDVAYQAALFRDADIIITTHGAGLSNLIFSKKETKVVEIFPPNLIYPVYWYISQICNLNYYFLIGEGETSDKLICYENFILDTKKLKNLLEKIL